jgi:hypothetical protein
MSVPAHLLHGNSLKRIVDQVGRVIYASYYILSKSITS